MKTTRGDNKSNIISHDDEVRQPLFGNYTCQRKIYIKQCLSNAVTYCSVDLEKGMASQSSIFTCKNPKDREAWQATAHGFAKESDMTEQLKSLILLLLVWMLSLVCNSEAPVLQLSYCFNQIWQILEPTSLQPDVFTGLPITHQTNN